MKLPHYILLFTLILLPTACHDTDDDDWGKKEESVVNENRNDDSQEPSLSRLEFPKVKGGSSIVLIHTTNDQYGINYSVEWDIEKKAQRWTAYQMTRNSDDGGAGYYGIFEEDPDLPASYRVSDSNSYYRGSGFTRGHICPSADRQYSKLANHQTFYYTNMQPQYYNFNAGDNYTSPWVRLEKQVRTWANATTTDTLYVVKGGTIDEAEKVLQTIRNELIVPKYFFMAMLLKNQQGYKAIGFWLEHDNSVHNGHEDLGGFAVNIRKLEELTGIDFFCNLPDDIENRVETLPLENIRRAWGI